MSEKMYLNLLLLCGIFHQGIFAKLPDEDPRVQSNLLVRKRRVINHLASGQLRIEEANYMVNIKYNNRAHCAGVILSHRSVLTAAECIVYSATQYQVQSGSANQHNNRIHNVTSKAVYYGNPPHKRFDGIGLITVYPLFEFGPKTGNIYLHVGYLPDDAEVTVFGWGCSYPPQPGPDTQRKLRTITLQLIPIEDCQNAYLHYYDITEKNLCTYDVLKYCALTDAGAPLVYNNRLTGIHVWKGERAGRINPDVFVDLQHAGYSQWIRENTLTL